MTKPKGSNKPTGGVGGRETKARKRAKTAAARDALTLDRRSAKLEQERAALASEMAQREQALRAKGQALRAKEAAFANKEEAAARAAAQREKREQEEVERVEAAAAAAAEKVAQDLGLHGHICARGRYENEAVLQVARTFKIGHDKERKTAKEDHGRRRLTEVQADQLREFINDEHKPGRQVFRRTVAEWMHRTCNMEQPSNRSVGGLLSRLGYKRRRGRIKTPPLNAERLVEMDMAKRAENAGLAVIVYTDESFVHQAHGSPYSYFPSDENGVVQDGIGRKTRKGLRMSMVHAITKWGALAKFCDGFPIEEGWFKETGSGKNTMGDEETAEFLWQAKLAKGDFHAAMTDSMFMERLEHRLSPACNAIPEFQGKQMILVLDNASYHHGFDAEGIGNLNQPDGYDTDDVSPVGHVEKRVGEQIQQESAEWGDGSDEVEP
ncbi:unnamed protein product [Ectocarpus sp. CCAP 1310/34]|nr:unnamed protein product [Ectocarpus sp. CCAP 1310/34]